MAYAGIHNVLFDLDGTLVDSLPGIDWSMRSAVREVLGPDAVCPATETLIGPPLDKMVARAFPGASDSTRMAIVAAYRRYYDHEGGWQRTTLYPAVATVLSSLRRRGIRLHIVTNKQMAAARRIVEHLGLQPSFDDIVAPDPPRKVFSSKAQALTELLHTAGVLPDSACMVGDSADDLEAARLARVHFIGVAYGYGHVELLVDGTCPVITAFTGLLAHV